MEKMTKRSGDVNDVLHELLLHVRGYVKARGPTSYMTLLTRKLFPLCAASCRGSGGDTRSSNVIGQIVCKKKSSPVSTVVANCYHIVYYWKLTEIVEQKSSV